MYHGTISSEVLSVYFEFQKENRESIEWQTWKKKKKRMADLYYYKWQEICFQNEEKGHQTEIQIYKKEWRAPKW